MATGLTHEAAVDFDPKWEQDVAKLRVRAAQEIAVLEKDILACRQHASWEKVNCRSGVGDGVGDGVGSSTRGHWTEQEHARFLEGMKQWPTTWKAIAAVVQTRSHSQCRSHAQTFPALKSASPQ
jgi:SHAQKYF class myb-like DNA-binding protein